MPLVCVLVHAGSVCWFAMKAERKSFHSQIHGKVHIPGRCFCGHVSAGLLNFCHTKLYAISGSCFVCRSEYFTQFLLVGCEEKCKIQVESNFHEGSNTGSACGLGICHSSFAFHNAAQILAHF